MDLERTASPLAVSGSKRSFARRLLRRIVVKGLALTWGASLVQKMSSVKDEEVYISQLYRRAMLLDDEFQLRVRKAMERAFGARSGLPSQCVQFPPTVVRMVLLAKCRAIYHVHRALASIHRNLEFFVYGVVVVMAKFDGAWIWWAR